MTGIWSKKQGIRTDKKMQDTQEAYNPVARFQRFQFTGNYETEKI